MNQPRVGISIAFVLGVLAASAPADAGPGEPPSRTIYVNDCAAGCTLRSGPDDSRTDRSSIVEGGARSLSAYAGSATDWDTMMTCVRATFAPFDVAIVEEDPGVAPHWEVMAAGRPTDLGLQSGVAGIAPFTCSLVPNAIAFAFLNLDPDQPDQACVLVSNMVATALGLEAEVLIGDVMSAAPGEPRVRRFTDRIACVGQTACCTPGTDCRCNNAEQNSFQKLRAIFGAAGGELDAGVDAPGDPDAGVEAPDAGGPGADGEDGGCCSTQRPGPAPIGLALVVLGLVLRRRRHMPVG